MPGYIPGKPKKGLFALGLGTGILGAGDLIVPAAVEGFGELLPLPPPDLLPVVLRP